MDVKEAIEVINHAVYVDGEIVGANEEEAWVTIKNELERNRWIPVSERLPKQYTRVLVYHDITDITDEAWFSGWFEYPYDADSRNSSNYGDVTHWMPLPEAPYQEVE